VYTDPEDPLTNSSVSLFFLFIKGQPADMLITRCLFVFSFLKVTGTCSLISLGIPLKGEMFSNKVTGIFFLPNCSPAYVPSYKKMFKLREKTPLLSQ